MPSPVPVASLRAVGLAALAALPFALAYRFAHVYRRRAGFPRSSPPIARPTDFGMSFETTSVEVDGLTLPAWFIPARGGLPGPGVALVHGWESARDRTLPNAGFLVAAGFHVLTFDVRGHGANASELLPISAGEFGADAAAGFDALVRRPEVTAGALLGHSMGSIGALLAAAADPRVAAVVATATPADPYRLTRQTFRLAHLPIPDPVAYPLAWLTTRVFLQPRGHAPGRISAAAAIARYRGPVLLIHGTDDMVVPVSHLGRLAARARRSRRDDPAAKPVESMAIAGGQHSWLYEFPAYRRAVARFLAEMLGGPLDPDEAGAVAVAASAVRLPEDGTRFSALLPAPATPPAIPPAR